MLGGLALAIVVLPAEARAEVDSAGHPGSQPDSASSTPLPTPPISPKFHLEAVRVEPPGGGTELLVRRHLPLRAGQMVDAATLLKARSYLASTGLFTDLDLRTTRGSRPGAVIAVVTARPSRRFYLESTAGREAFGGWHWNVVGLRRTGLFGSGTARVGYRAGLRAHGLYADLEVPALFARDTDLLVTLGRYRDTWLIRQDDSTDHQAIDRTRLRVGVRKRLTEDLSTVLIGGFSQASPEPSLSTDQEGPDIPAAGIVPVYPDDLRYGELQASLVFDRQDRLRAWQCGSWTGWAVRGAVPNRGERFWGSDFEARVAVPVAGTRAAAFRFRAAYTSKDTPYFLRPVVGGTGSVRGFPDAGLSGPLGARALCLISAEWRHPLVGARSRAPWVIGTVFVDGGDHWTAGGRRADPAAGAGGGLLLRLPAVQTVNLEIAWPLTDPVRGSPVVYYLSLGRSF